MWSVECGIIRGYACDFELQTSELGVTDFKIMSNEFKNHKF